MLSVRTYCQLRVAAGYKRITNVTPALPVITYKASTLEEIASVCRLQEGALRVSACQNLLFSFVLWAELPHHNVCNWMCEVSWQQCKLKQ